MSVYDFFTDFAIASVCILIGQFLRAKIRFFQCFFIPSSMIAGIMGLLLGKQFLNILPFSSGAGSYAGVLVIIIFTVVGINGISKKKADSESAVKRIVSFSFYRWTTSFIQYCFGILAAITLIRWLVPNIHPGFGLLMSAGFTGGHGTAAAVGKTFANLGWNEASDLGMTFATVGILLGVFGGIIWIKVATKMGWTSYIKDFKYVSGDMRTGLIAKENRTPLGCETISQVSLDTLAFHLSLVLAIAGCAYLINSKLIAPNLIDGIPDYTIAYVLGLLFFFVLRNTKVYDYIDRDINSRISGTATDYVVFFGVAMINVQVIIDYAIPLMIAILVGIFCLVITIIPLGCCMNDKNWFERSIFVYGYSAGVFAIGLVLLRIVDPQNKSHTVEDAAMSPWTSLAEIVVWSSIPVALCSGQAWTVVLITGACAVIPVILAVVGKMWYRKPLAGRDG